MTNSPTDDLAARAYDETPYPSAAYPQTHPDHLAVIGRLFGIRATPVETCRVLELGGSDGGNLIPMAVNLPNAEFVGVDISARHIKMGQDLIRRLGLRNIALRRGSILDIDRKWGVFDYIIAHGVFSWVPRPVQEKIFEICRERLAPQGVAFVSYNTYPGWRLQGMIRDMMLYHAGRFEDPGERIRQARALIQFLAEEVSGQDTPYALLLRDELQRMQSRTETYFRHELLEEINEPLYFHQFAERARSHALQYLGESEFHTMLLDNLSSNASHTLERLTTSQIDIEQYMDFVRNRTFRQTLLCHDQIAIKRRIDADQLTDLHAASPLKPASSTGDAASDQGEEFVHRSSGQVVTVHGPLAGAALTELSGRWPGSLSLKALIARTTPRPTEQEVDGLKKLLLHLFAKNLVVLYATPPPVVSSVSERPLATPLARFQAGVQSTVTTQLHIRVELDDMHRRLLAMLDGACSQDALVERLVEQALRGDFELQEHGRRIRDAARIRNLFASEVDPCLARLAESALLIG
jgi:methyltransferase-like protein/2-polyprenyl-3-methyl-5-hydroxy-6-metoxy-1,4-benzoquinol methylase